MGVYRKSLDEPEATEEYDGDGVAGGVQIGDNVVWRSVLKPGWSWTKNAEPREGHGLLPGLPSRVRRAGHDRLSDARRHERRVQTKATS